MATSLVFDLLARDRASDTFKKVGRASEDAGRKVHGLNGAFGAVTAGSRGLRSSFGLIGKGAAFAAGAAGVGGLVVAFKGVYSEAREAQKVSAQTAAVIKSTGGAAKVSANQVGALATAISNKVGVDDEAIQSGANLLLTFTGIRNEAGKGNDVFDRATQTITDMAAAMNQGKVTTDGLKTASIQVGKALQDPIKGITALRKVGVSFTDQQQSQIKTLVSSGHSLEAQKIILNELNKEFGGSAAAGTNAMQKLGVIFGNIKEQVGTALLPVIDGFANWLSRILPAAVAVGVTAVGKIGTGLKALYDLLVKGDFTGAFAKVFHVQEDSGVVDFLFKIRDGVLAMVAAFREGDVTSTGFVGVMERVGVVARTVVIGVQAMVTAFKEGDVTSTGFVGVMERIGVALRTTAKFIAEHRVLLGYMAAGIVAVVAALKVFRTVMLAVNLIMSANPIGLVVVALGALVGGLVFAYRHSERFRDIVNTVWAGARQLWSFLAKNLAPIFQALGQFISQRVSPALQGLFVRLQQVWPTVAQVAKFVGTLIAILGVLVVKIAAFVVPLLLKLAGPIFTLLFAAIGKAIGVIAALARIAISVTSTVVRVFLAMAGGIINAAARAFGWVPGIGPKLKSAANAFNAFRDEVNRSLGGVKSRKVTVTAELHGVAGGGGKSIGFASGGPVFGAGSATSDSIPALLSNGEHVLSAREVRGMGGHAAVTQMRKAAVGFAGGGPVGLTVEPQLTGLDRLNRAIGTFNSRVDAMARKLFATSVGATGRAPGAVGGNAALGRLLAAQLYGWTGGQWSALFNLWQGESGWNNNAQNPTSTAYGIAQFLNSTWATVGAQKTSNPAGQIRAGLAYIRRVYGTPANAYGRWLSRSPHWYGSGLEPTMFNRPTLIGVGERGPEMVSVTPQRMLQPGRGGGAGNTYNIRVSVPVGANPRETGRQLVEAIRAYEKGSGAVLAR